MSTAPRTLTAARAYFDTSDGNNEGWAYQLAFNDGHQESGEMGVNSYDADPRPELEAIVVAHGGDYAAGRVTYFDADNGGYDWRAPE